MKTHKFKENYELWTHENLPTFGQCKKLVDKLNKDLEIERNEANGEKVITGPNRDYGSWLHLFILDCEPSSEPAKYDFRNKLIYTLNEIEWVVKREAALEIINNETV